MHFRFWWVWLSSENFYLEPWLKHIKRSSFLFSESHKARRQIKLIENCSLLPCLTSNFIKKVSFESSQSRGQSRKPLNYLKKRYFICWKGNNGEGISIEKRISSALIESQASTISDHTSGIPTLGCQVDRPDESSTSARYNGNGKRAAMRTNQLETAVGQEPNLWRTYVANTPSNSAFLTCGAGLICLAFDAEIHDVITTNSTVVDDNIWKDIKIRFLRAIFRIQSWRSSCIQGYESPIKISLFSLPQAQRATAFHWNKKIKKQQLIKELERYLMNSQKWNVIEFQTKRNFTFLTFLTSNLFLSPFVPVDEDGAWSISSSSISILTEIYDIFERITIANFVRIGNFEGWKGYKRFKKLAVKF